MYQYKIILRLFIISLITLSITACGVKEESAIVFSNEPNPILEVKGDGDVHYEHVGPDGTFESHEIITDPLGKSYNKGIAVPNKLSDQKTILDSGPVANRVDLVMVGDGYTATEMTKYETDAQNIVTNYFNQEPLKSYKNYFNVHRIDVVSAQSGVDNDPSQGISKDTALDMNFWCGGIDRLLCVNTSSAKSYAANAPAVDQILVLANSTKYGGAGYWSDGLATMAAGNSSAIELALHELAHSFAKLGDEYSYAGASTSECLAKANGSHVDSTTMLSQKSKWFRWLDLPNIGTFEGTCYSDSGYRPTSYSKMRNLGYDFYEVNNEQYIFEIYSKVKPIDTATAVGTYDQNVNLSVTPMQPVGYNLDVKWYLNGVEITSAAQSKNLAVSNLNLVSGSHTIMVKVTDTTTSVRDEAKRASLMTQTRLWEIKSIGNGEQLNQAPLAANDSVNTQENKGILIDPLANDSDPDGDAISLNSVGAPTRGTAVIVNGKIKYIPFTNKNGVDTFIYSIKDSNGAEASAKIIVYIASVNSAPLAKNDSAKMLPNNSITISALSNDSDPDGDEISLVSVSTPSYGQAYIIDSLIVYTPQSDFLGTDVFDYTIKDVNGAQSSAQVSVTVSNSPTIAFSGLNSASSYHSGYNSAGLKFSLSATITISKVSVESLLQGSVNNIAIYKEEGLTPIALLSIDTSTGNYSTTADIKLTPGTYLIVALVSKYKKSSIANITDSPELTILQGAKSYSKGAIQYPTGSSSFYVYGNINFEYRK